MTHDARSEVRIVNGREYRVTYLPPAEVAPIPDYVRNRNRLFQGLPVDVDPDAVPFDHDGHIPVVAAYETGAAWDGYR